MDEKIEKKKNLKSIMDFTSKGDDIHSYIESLVELKMNSKYVIHKIAPFDTFDQFKSLKQLSLCNNQIEFIHENAFWGLTSLEELFLDNNYISEIR
jgi:Leucine-rich repeat (LRR) protein